MSQTPISSKQTLAFQSAKRTLTETSPDEMPGSSKKLVGNIQVSDLMNMMQKSMEGIMDEKLKNLATKSDFEDIKTNVAEIDKKCEDLKNENEILRSEINKLKAERERDNENLRRLVDQSKRKNVIFKGIKKQGSPKNSVENVCINVLKLNDLKIKMARTLYSNNGKIGVVAEMQTEEMVHKIFKNTKNLTGSTIIIERDLSEERQQDRKVLLQIKSAILQTDKTHKIFVRNDSLKIGNKWLHFSKNRELMSGSNKAETVLKELYGNKLADLNIDYMHLLKNVIQKN